MDDPRGGQLTDSHDELLAFFSALADEDRLVIAATVARRPSTTAEIAAATGLRQQEVSRHLALLERAGIVAGDAEAGTWGLNVAALRERRRALLSRERRGPADVAADASESERRVLATFIDGERLRSIPVAHEKKLVVLRWLAGRFEPDTRYPEREINAILKRHHPDSASLRRALVDHGLMHREAGIYWRVDPDSPA